MRISFETIVDSGDSSIFDVRSKAPGPRGSLPITAEMLLNRPSEKSAGRKSGRLEKFSLTATQAILYFDSITPGETVTLRFRLRAEYPIGARTFQSRVYE